ncbi:Ornithine cyclodeaminase [Hyphomicrobiales bacterium]|nr:Ornithine cyclodeaminase [Hyphomicrobiales bacterium]CAH1694925.1 Ornithine cyclodeaminase [Hyphomicrobiales bacterium]
MITLRYLSRADVIAAGGDDWALALADVREATRLLRAGEAGMEAESVMPMGGDPRAKAYGLPAFVGGGYDAAGLKWAVHLPESLGDLPSITNTTFINRLSDGRPLGLVESALLTRMRTAAVTALAMESLLPRPPSRVAILGAGAQAQAHLAMVLALFPTVGEIRLWNRTNARLDALLTNAPAPTGVALVRCAAIADAIANADVILSCTTAPQPILDAGAVRSGRLIVQVGYHEVAFSAIAASDVVTVDQWGHFAEKSAKSLFQMYRAGEFKPDRVAADLAGMVVDGWRPPPEASLYFSSFGLNLFDIALAARILHQAEAAGVGTTLPYL